MASTSSRSGARRTNVRTAKPRTPGGALGGLIGAIIMSVVAGVLVTVAVTPVVAVTGMAATSAISIFENLPNHINPGQLAQPSVILAKAPDGSEVQLATFYQQNREMVGWDDISQYVKDAAVSAEDRNFYTHGGVDFIGLSRAVLGQVTGSSDSGASTITMQYVRNVLVQQAEAILDEEEREKAYNDAMRQDIDRKLQEIRYAVSIEKKYSKDEILLGYLNIALFGRNIYGIESAAQSYYGKSAKDVTLAEAASLIAIVQFPSSLNLASEDNLAANKERRDWVLGQMLKEHRITQEQYDEAIATEVTPNLTPRQTGCTVAERNYGLGHFCDMVQRTIELDPNFGNSDEERHFQFLRGGYRIMTTIDLDLQAAAVSSVRENIPPTMEGIDIGAAVSSVEVSTGRILAMAQNRAFENDPEALAADPGLTSINFNTDYELGGSNGFQVGSTMKAFTLAEWLRAGNSLYDSVNGNGRTVNYSDFRASCLGGVYGSGPWQFRNNAGETPGNTTVMNGTAQSLNGVFVSMQQRLDLCDTVELAQSLGVHRASPQTIEGLTNTGTTDLTITPSLAMAGTDEIAPVTMAAAYAAFANQGVVCKPVPIDWITDANGEEVNFSKPPCTEAISPEVAAGVLHALENVVQVGTGTHARSPIGVPHFIKTGTTDDQVDRWNVGGSTTVATAVWTGNVVGFSSLDNTWLGRPERAIFASVMTAADYKYGGDAFPEPPRSAVQRVMVPVPSVTGLSFAEAEALLRAAGFDVVNGGEVDSSLPAGQVAATNPSGEAGRGATISVQTSNGALKRIPDGLVGMGRDAARQVLAGESFSNVDVQCAAEPEPAGDPKPNSKVVSVSPGSGTEARPGNRVTLSVECGP